MLNTFNLKSDWIDKQNSFIESVKSNPLIGLIKIPLNFGTNEYILEQASSIIDELIRSNVTHIEIRYSDKIGLKNLILDLKNSYPYIKFGIASINEVSSLKLIKDLKLEYSMSSHWDSRIQNIAKNEKLIIIPGVMTPTEIKFAINFGWNVIKLFPASILGFDYLKMVDKTISKMPFTIAAGGINQCDFTKWVDNGYGGVVISNDLIKINKI